MQSLFQVILSIINYITLNLTISIIFIHYLTSNLWFLIVGFKLYYRFYFH